jgi:hypothetical protein
VSLHEVVAIMVRVAAAERRVRGVDWRRLVNNKVRVIISPDATPIWRTSVTRCDVFVDVWASGADAAAKPSNWNTWFLFDGADDAVCLETFADITRLNAQVRELQDASKHWVSVDGGHETQVAGFECYLTGDGKCMVSMNAQPGQRCWLCRGSHTEWADPLNMQASDNIPPSGRLGTFLPAIPPRCRVGDYLHAMCRILNAFLYRVRKWFTGTAKRRPFGRAFEDIVENCKAEAARVPAADKTGSRGGGGGFGPVFHEGLFDKRSTRDRI